MPKSIKLHPPVPVTTCLLRRSKLLPRSCMKNISGSIDNRSMGGGLGHRPPPEATRVGPRGLQRTKHSAITLPAVSSAILSGAPTGTLTRAPVLDWVLVD